MHHPASGPVQHDAGLGLGCAWCCKRGSKLLCSRVQAPRARCLGKACKQAAAADVCGIVPIHLSAGPWAAQCCSKTR